jgi:hypothetical protein
MRKLITFDSSKPCYELLKKELANDGFLPATPSNRTAEFGWPSYGFFYEGDCSSDGLEQKVRDVFDKKNSSLEYGQAEYKFEKFAIKPLN